MNPVRGHAVDGGHGPQGHGALISALVTHHSDAPHRKQDGARLPDGVVETVLVQLVYVDGVSLLDNGYLLRSNLAQDADTESGARERMAAKDGRIKPESLADTADLILEEKTEAPPP